MLLHGLVLDTVPLKDLHSNVLRRRRSEDSDTVILEETRCILYFRSRERQTQLLAWQVTTWAVLLQALSACRCHS
jgi:hypothetical protein